MPAYSSSNNTNRRITNSSRSHRSGSLHAREASLVLFLEDTNDGIFRGLVLTNAQLGIGPHGRILSFGAFNAYADESTKSSPVACSLDAEVVPDCLEGFDEVVAVFLYVSGSWGDTETFFASRHGGVVNGLDINSVLF